MKPASWGWGEAGFIGVSYGQAWACTSMRSGPRKEKWLRASDLGRECATTSVVSGPSGGWLFSCLHDNGTVADWKGFAPHV